ncbi:MAG: hypothetical protein U0793_11510 [Gemmataceae bacterium]
MSRGLAFWTDDTIKLIRDNFVAAAVPTWVARAKGPEGEFLRKAGVDKQWVTSSGYMTCVSASGKMLGHAPSQKVLEAFRKLPDSERGPGAVAVADIEPAERLVPSPPAGGLVLRVHARFLSRDGMGDLRHATVDDFPLMAKSPASFRLFLEPNTEYLWLTAEEWKSLVPGKLVKGETLAVDPRTVDRMARFHLTPRRAMTSEGGILGKSAVKSAKLDLVVEDVSPERARLRLIGFVHTGTTFDKEKATTPNGPLGFGFQSPLHGVLEYDRTAKRFTRFDLIAPGDVWGRWGDANDKSLFVERPGSTPFGFALELAGTSPTERIPPGGNPAYIGPKSGYFGAGK